MKTSQSGAGVQCVNEWIREKRSRKCPRSRSGGRVGRQGQPVTSQEVAGRKVPEVLSGRGKSPPSCHLSPPLSWLDPVSDEGREGAAHVQAPRRSNLFIISVEEGNTLSAQVSRQQCLAVTARTAPGEEWQVPVVWERGTRGSSGIRCLTIILDFSCTNTSM